MSTAFSNTAQSSSRATCTSLGLPHAQRAVPSQAIRMTGGSDRRSRDRDWLKPTEVGLDLERLVFFSDAIFAIAITVLVLELPRPGSTPRERLLAEHGRDFVAYGLSFWVLSLFWLGHHRTFRWVRDYDAGLVSPQGARFDGARRVRLPRRPARRSGAGPVASSLSRVSRSRHAGRVLDHDPGGGARQLPDRVVALGVAVRPAAGWTTHLRGTGSPPKRGRERHDQPNARTPVSAAPTIRVWISSVPSYVMTDSRFTTWRMTG